MHVSTYRRAERFRERMWWSHGQRNMWGEQTRDGRTFLPSIQVHDILRRNWSSNYSSELWFVLPFVVLPSKSKWGIHVDVAVSCAESRDQRRRREKMRGVGRRGEGVRAGQKWKGLHFTEDHKTLAETGPLNKIKVTPPQLGEQQRGSVTVYLQDWNTSLSPAVSWSLAVIDAVM